MLRVLFVFEMVIYLYERNYKFKGVCDIVDSIFFIEYILKYLNIY